MLLRCIQENTLTYQSDCYFTLQGFDYLIKNQNKNLVYSIITCIKLFSLIQNQPDKYLNYLRSLIFTGTKSFLKTLQRFYLSVTMDMYSVLT